ncbi:MerR family transcriptional regulator [Pseudoclavibacter soli]|uniref:transcriptional regulator FtsR n=1 Tax=Pseudoclavibacter soli TaxID=452623 RepID=UPI000429DA79|nr:MerR family transcriptional regulator [Pseudoclavibacter soli]
MAAVARRAAGEAEPAERLLSIGQVLTRLAVDFPDVTPSKLRFLEEQGLVTPRRTESGYRKFCSADVERLHLVLSLQRDHYLPLRVIRTYLAEIDAGRTPVLPGMLTASGVQGALPTVYSRDELLEHTGASADLLREAVSAGLLPTGTRFDQHARHLLEVLVSLQTRGIDPRHLRGMRAAADREAGLIHNAISGVRRSDAESAAQASSEANALADLLLDVKRTLLIRALEEPEN